MPTTTYRVHLATGRTVKRRLPCDSAAARAQAKVMAGRNPAWCDSVWVSLGGDAFAVDWYGEIREPPEYVPGDYRP